MSRPFRILSLDGGGAKGVFTLGVLKQLEAELGAPLNQHFDLVYGTSTGAIIACFTCLGASVDDIYKYYLDIIPDVFSRKTRSNRHHALRKHARNFFGHTKFEDFTPLIGIVATDCDNARPKIFKNNASQAFSRQGNFEAGFGASVEDALLASCAAVPVLPPVKVKTNNQGMPELLDGGFVANNPAVFAMTDATGSLKIDASDVRLLSVGTGQFSARNKIGDWITLGAIGMFVHVKQLFSTLDANANATHFLVEQLFKEAGYVRVNGENTRIFCDLKTTDVKELEKAYVFGSDSFGKQENEILNLFY